MLPFNLEHLGKPLYGLWILTASITTSFGLLDLGYGGSLVRFIAQYRSLGDRRSLNAILSTLFVVYALIGLATCGIALVLAANIDSIFRIDPADVPAAQQVLLIISIYVAGRFVFSVYGGVVVGFQRYHMNNVVSIIMSVAVAAVNVAVLLAGFGLVALVAATTGTRLLCLLLYRRNAHRVFPEMHIRVRDFSQARLREVSGFSIYMLLFSLGQKLNFAADTLVLGAFVGPAAVAVWAPAQRLSHLLTRLTNQLNDALFPVVVDSDATNRTGRLRETLVHGTRLSLAMVVPLAGGVAFVAHPLIEAWVGPTFAESAIILQFLAVLVVLRVGTSTASVILQGAGEHARLTAYVGVTGLANLALSIALVKPYGLIGVAIGSIIPVAAMSATATFPQACRRVGLPLSRGLREAVWPAVWPAIPAIGWLQVSPVFDDNHLVSLAVALAVGAAIYVALFFCVALGRAERTGYIRRLRDVLPQPAVVAAPNPGQGV
jgi:O-antigen/teichoic acid export membrane protein